MSRHSATALLACAMALAPCAWAQAGGSAPVVPASTFIAYQKNNPPEAVQRMLATRPASRATNPDQTGKSYRATLMYPGAAPVEFVSEAPQLSYAGGDDGNGNPEHRQSTGSAGPGLWGASQQQLSTRFFTDGFVDGGYTLYDGSNPGMTYSLVFDELPGLPGWGGFVSYEVHAGEAVLNWDRTADSSSGSFAFTVQVEATPAHWGIGPDQDYLLEVTGDFID